MNLQITPGGLRALAAGGGETQSVRITRIALGSGRGPGGASDADRAALRTPRDAVVVVAGEPSNAARLTVSAAISPTGAAYSVSEVGVFARPVDGAGPVGDELLFAFWTHPTDTLAAAAPGVDVVIAVVVDVRPAGAASATVTTSAPIVFAASMTLTDLVDTPTALAAQRLLRVSAAADAVETVSPAEIAAQLAAAAPMRLLAFSVSGSVTAPDYRATWLVAAWGAGAGGTAQAPVLDLFPPQAESLPGSGGRTRLTAGQPPADVVAAAGGVPRSRGAGNPGANVGDLVVAGRGAVGGWGYRGRQSYPPVPRAGRYGSRGRSGDLVVSLVTPVRGQQYGVEIGAGGTAGQYKPTTQAGQSGSPGRLLILEFRQSRM